MNLMQCGGVCSCKQIVNKINLLKPMSIEEISWEVPNVVGKCTSQITYNPAKQLFLNINWGTKTEVIIIHKMMSYGIKQAVTMYMPF
jgi:hypothetical protein